MTFIDNKLDLARMPSYVRAEGARPTQLRNVSGPRKIMAEPAA